MITIYLVDGGEYMYIFLWGKIVWGGITCRNIFWNAMVGSRRSVTLWKFQGKGYP